jgi:Holliday junction resolvasome RuvABC endonuclease subunit
MRVMGVDASPSCTGFAIYDTNINDFIKVNKIRSSKKKATPTIARRIEYICTELSHEIFFNEVDVIIIEDIFVNPKQTASSVIPLGMLRGAIQEMVYGLDFKDLHVIETKRMKKAVTGKGNCNKLATYKALKRIYKKSKVVREALGKELLSANNAQKNEDMADAIGLVYSYLKDPSLAHPA